MDSSDKVGSWVNGSIGIGSNRDGSGLESLGICRLSGDDSRFFLRIGLFSKKFKTIRECLSSRSFNECSIFYFYFNL